MTTFVDVSLRDAAAMGLNTVEREGVSVTHPARFILVGTMNPEEGELRPQLLDRFGLCVDVGGAMEIEERVRIMEQDQKRALDSEGFSREAGARKKPESGPESSPPVERIWPAGRSGAHHAGAVLEPGGGCGALRTSGRHRLLVSGLPGPRRGCVVWAGRRPGRDPGRRRVRPQPSPPRAVTRHPPRAPGRPPPAGRGEAQRTRGRRRKGQG